MIDGRNPDEDLRTASVGTVKLPDNEPAGGDVLSSTVG